MEGKFSPPKRFTWISIGSMFLSLVLWECSYFGQRGEAGSKDYVILLHGLARTQRSMAALQFQLTKLGYNVKNIGYPSTKMSLQEIVEYVRERIAQQHFPSNRKIHFVTHSMGGIVIRLYLEKYHFPNLGRVVMICPPNQGSELADLLKKVPLLEKILGPASVQLTTDPASFPNRLGAVNFQLGVIAGDKNPNPVFSIFFHGPNDGKVSVKSTQVKGMRDFCVIHESHQIILYHPEMVARIVSFLEKGSFDDREMSEPKHFQKEEKRIH